MDVAINEGPGGIGDVYECPYCSKSYLVINPENGRSLRPPDDCERCGSPMDVAKSLAFADAQAKLGAGEKPVGSRRTVKV